MLVLGAEGGHQGLTKGVLSILAPDSLGGRFTGVGRAARSAPAKDLPWKKFPYPSTSKSLAVATGPSAMCAGRAAGVPSSLDVWEAAPRHSGGLGPGLWARTWPGSAATRASAWACKFHAALLRCDPRPWLPPARAVCLVCAAAPTTPFSSVKAEGATV